MGSSGAGRNCVMDAFSKKGKKEEEPESMLKVVTLAQRRGSGARMASRCGGAGCGTTLQALQSTWDTPKVSGLVQRYNVLVSQNGQ